MAVITLKGASIVAGYAVVFWVLLPATLIWLGVSIDAWLGLSGDASMTGALPVALGLGIVTWGMTELWRHGRGLPIGALPPSQIVVTGPYRWSRHPIYVGWNLALFGTGVIVGSPGLAFFMAPGFLPGWVLYAGLEERVLMRRFGRRYERYRRNVGVLPMVSLYQVVRALCRLTFMPVKTEGAHYIPRTGPVVLVGNHSCYLDPMFLLRATPRRICYVSTAQIFRARLYSLLFSRLHVIPLRRYRLDPSACRELIMALAEGDVIGIFPEGERTPDGGRQMPAPQVARIVAQLPATIVPVGISGGADVGPRWSSILRRKPVTVRIGPPLRLNTESAADQIAEAWSCLLPERDQPVHLQGLDLQRLGRIIWRCPGCGDESGFRPDLLACGFCGRQWWPAAEGGVRDVHRTSVSIASLARSVTAFSDHYVFETAAEASWEPSIYGAIGPLTPLGSDRLVVCPSGITFGALNIRIADIRSVTTEGADVLQIATRESMWQFRPRQQSVFRLKAAMDRWRGPAPADRYARREPAWLTPSPSAGRVSACHPSRA